LGRSPLAKHVFDRFPQGILIFSHSGTLAGVNRAVPKLFGPLRRRADGAPLRCCDLLGCHTPGPLADVCLSQLAAKASEPLPDMRIELPATAPIGAVWLTAAPLHDDEGHFLVAVRAADPSERRQRSRVGWTGEPSLRVFALGRTRLEGPAGPIPGRWLEQRPGHLFKYLICERRRIVYPEEIAKAIWLSDDAAVLSNVRYFVHRLRRHLEPEPPPGGPSSFILAIDGGYTIDPSVWVDADEFERLVSLGLKARKRGQDGDAVKNLGQAMALYRGDLISDIPDAPWMFEEREGLRGLAEQALSELVEIDLQSENLDGAIEHLRRLVQLEPVDLELHRWLLSLLLRRGRRSEAVRRYSSLKAMLRTQFGEELDFELADLAAEGAAYTGGPSSLAPGDPRARTSR
jgi:DNA-binding SARP family transcriptional activator